MKRFHVHLHVDDLARSVAFYSSLFAAQPSRVEADYAKWMLDDPALNFAISTRGDAAGIVRVGINGMGRIGRLALRAAMGAAERQADDPRAATGWRWCTSTSSRAARRPPRTCWPSTACRALARRHPRRGTTRSASTTAAGLLVARQRGRDPLGRPGRGPGARMHRQVPDPRDPAGPPRPRRQAGDRGRAGQGGRRAQHRGRHQPQLYEPARHRIVTAASCTTNCLAPVVKVVHEASASATARSPPSTTRPTPTWWSMRRTRTCAAPAARC
jgi:catechol 2,3-dioxygenase-like lactoylglutathione lyase family enzyme